MVTSAAAAVASVVVPAADNTSAAAAAVATDVATAATAGGPNRVGWYVLVPILLYIYDHITNTNVIENSHFREISRWLNDNYTWYMTPVPSWCHR